MKTEKDKLYTPSQWSRQPDALNAHIKFLTKGMCINQIK